MVLVTAPFESVARASATARAVADLPIVVFPAGFDDLDEQQIDELIDERLPAIVQGLLRC